MSRNEDRGSPSDVFRPPTESEVQLLTILLDVPFTGNEELRTQATNAKVRSIDTNGSLAIEVDPSPRAEVKRRIPVEAEVEDDDGTTIHLLVHVEDGLLSELEIYREDSAIVIGEINPSKLRPIVI